MRSHITTERLVGSEEEAWEGWLGSHAQELKSWRNISVAGGVPHEKRVGCPAYSTRSRKGTQIALSYEKKQGFSLPGRNGWRLREPLKGPTHKISLAATYSGLQQKAAEWTKDTWGEFLGWWLWRENWKDSQQDPCAESFSILQRLSFSGCALPSKEHQSEGKQ